MPEKKNKEQAIHSSAAEYLTFVASIGDSDTSYEMRYEDENIWLTQKMMATLYDVSKQTISQHIKRIYADGELAPEATVKKYLTVQTEGDRQISRKQDHYNLQMIIAVGFKVNNQRAVQFRNNFLKDPHRLLIRNKIRPPDQKKKAPGPDLLSRDGCRSQGKYPSPPPAPAVSSCCSHKYSCRVIPNDP